jgi:shikimate dehydrogenase
VFQAVEAFRLFTGTTPDAERMLRHFSSVGGDAESQPPVRSHD